MVLRQYPSNSKELCIQQETPQNAEEIVEANSALCPGLRRIGDAEQSVLAK